MTTLNNDQIKQEASALYEQVLAVRRHLHAYPELSFAEHETSRYLAEQLTSAGIAFRPIAGTGLLARLEGTGDLTQCVVLRADMDALPIQEKTGLPFASCNSGVMHACGHDIHSATLLGTLLLLNRHRDTFNGTVFGLFQPGEEVAPGGASLVLHEEPFAAYNVRAVVGLHVGAEIPVGRLGFRAGQYMASGDEVRLTVRGHGGHGALPHRLNDPVVAAAALITALQQIVSRNIDATTPAVLSFGKVIAEGATNVIPHEVYIEGTFRTMNEGWRESGKRRIREIAQGIAIAYGVHIEADLADGYPCVINDNVLTQRAEVLAQKMWGKENILPLSLRMTAEDFGFYTTRYPSLFFRLGTARPDDSAAAELHTGNFNPDEKALQQGVATMSALALEFANRN